MKGLVMYIQIKELESKGFSVRASARMLKVNRETITKYRNMSLEEYQNLSYKLKGTSKIDPYKAVILKWLKEFPEMTAAQIYDWVLERYGDVNFAERSVSRYVKLLREEYDIPKKKNPREYQAVQELQPGQQMQIDFGVKSMPLPDKKGYKKVYFLASVLSHSRTKWAYFQDKPFTSVDFVNAMNKCFEYYGGVTNEIVIDQDSILTVNENYGDIIYTYEFQKYRELHSLNIYVCRKSDPESKGKVENVVGYIKHGFLDHREYMEPDELNQKFTKWLDRTGNRKPHGTTKKIPIEVFEFEREHLRPIFLQDNTSYENSIQRNVQKDNTIIYKSNRYTVPLGTYTKHKIVLLDPSDDVLRINSLDTGEMIAEHRVSTGKGKLVQNHNHLRDNTKSIQNYEKHILDQIGYEWIEYLTEVQNKYPRYYRDQLSMIDKLIHEHSIDILNQSLNYCETNQLFSVNELKDACQYFDNVEIKQTLTIPQNRIKPIINPEVVTITTQKRSILEYEMIGGVTHE